MWGLQYADDFIVLVKSANAAKRVLAALIRYTEGRLQLTVRLYSLMVRKNNAAVAHLCAELNATETIYPGTDLRMIFKPVLS